MEKGITILKSFEEDTWITKDNQKIKIKDLSLLHLKNIIKYLRKKYDSLENPLNDYPSFQGKMAQMYAEQCWESTMKQYNQLELKIKLFTAYYNIKNL